MVIYKPSEFAEKIGVSLKTLQIWDNKGLFPSRRTPTNRRYYTSSDVEEYFKSKQVSHDGRWICIEGNKVRCSVCGAVYNYDDNYCGSCGARMIWTDNERHNYNARKQAFEKEVNNDVCK